MNEEKRFAVLIDAENVSSKYVKRILDEISNYGIVTYKRIYGDWTGPARSGWKAVLLGGFGISLCGGSVPVMARSILSAALCRISLVTCA